MEGKLSNEYKLTTQRNGFDDTRKESFKLPKFKSYTKILNVIL